MQLILKTPQVSDAEQTHQIHLFWLIEGLITLSFTVESIIEIIILPANSLRWLMVIGVVISAGLLSFLLARAGKIRLAGLTFIGMLWALFTGLAITENGIRAPTVDIAYLVIILVAGLMLGDQAGIITGIVCSLTLLGLSFAGVQNLLPASQVIRSVWATWEADIFYLVIVLGLQYLSIHAIKDALEQAHHELTERRRVEANLRKAEEERAQSQMRMELHQLLGEHLEKERLKIARDLHDGPVQDLIGATFTLQELIETAPDDDYRETLQGVRDSLREQVASLRSFAAELRSPTLMQFGLRKAIQEHISNFNHKHPEIEVGFEIDPAFPSLTDETRVALFRIYQEVMNNIVKHAQATQVAVWLGLGENCLQMKIRDNGVGFTTPDEWIDLARNGHLGLVGMRERAEALGGHFEIASIDDRGTEVLVSLPFDKLPQE